MEEVRRVFTQNKSDADGIWILFTSSDTQTIELGLWYVILSNQLSVVLICLFTHPEDQFIEWPEVDTWKKRPKSFVN